MRPDGRPHLAGVGALWLDGDFYFVSGEGTRKSQNLAENPNCVLSVALPDLDLVVEGTATQVTDDATLQRLAESYVAQGWPVHVENGAFTAPYSAPSAGPPPWNLYVVTPSVAFGVGSAGEARRHALALRELNRLPIHGRSARRTWDAIGQCGVSTALPGAPQVWTGRGRLPPAPHRSLWDVLTPPFPHIGMRSKTIAYLTLHAGKETQYGKTDVLRQSRHLTATSPTKVAISIGPRRMRGPRLRQRPRAPDWNSPLRATTCTM